MALSTPFGPSTLENRELPAVRRRAERVGVGAHRVAERDQESVVRRTRRQAQTASRLEVTAAAAGHHDGYAARLVRPGAHVVHADDDAAVEHRLARRIDDCLHLTNDVG